MSYRTVAHHALTVYYDGDAELARKVLDGHADDVRRETLNEAADALETYACPGSGAYRTDMELVVKLRSMAEGGEAR